MLRIAVLCLIICAALSGCLSYPAPYYQKQEPIPKNAWNYNFRPLFKFEITDSASRYQPYFIVQHTQAYPYNNLWMWIYIKTPGDSIIKKERVNITLAAPNGQWLGRGLGAIYEERVAVDLGDSVRFNRNGLYEIALEQNMRVNPLPEVLHIGFRLEKAALR
ncbi:MAG: gliding motility lipoprotein GldH [Taibaiella sp.]|nr:gliding motility lipoprotein GldH [Taibaiella sp.]